MPKVFLSHNRLNKPLVHIIHKKLLTAFVDSWLDEKKLNTGDYLDDEIFPRIKRSDYFIPFISKSYTTKWCNDEFNKAIDSNIPILPVLIVERGERMNTGKPDWFGTLSDKVQETFLKQTLLRIQIDEPATGMEDEEDFEEMKDRIDKAVIKLAKSIWKGRRLRFKPMKLVKLGAIEAQLFAFDMDGILEEDYLKELRLEFDITELISKDSEDEKPIRKKPVIFSGTSVNWLITFLTMPLTNKRDVLIYNEGIGKVVCVYTKPVPAHPDLKIGNVYPLEV